MLQYNNDNNNDNSNIASRDLTPGGTPRRPLVAHGTQNNNNIIILYYYTVGRRRRLTDGRRLRRSDTSSRRFEPRPHRTGTGSRVDNYYVVSRRVLHSTARVHAREFDGGGASQRTRVRKTLNCQARRRIDV